MRAIHPKTGKPINIIRTEATITKTNRTLVWVSSTMTGNRWNRWSTLINDSSATSVVAKPDIALINGPIVNDQIDGWKRCIEENANDTLFVVSPEWLETLRINAASTSSLLVTTELYERYPFLPNLDAAASADKWVAAIAILLRFSKLVSPTTITLKEFTETVVNISPTANSDDVVPPIYLIQQYFVPTRSQRAREIRTALERNLACPLVDHVILLNESEYALPDSSKIKQINIGKRMTYLDVFKYIRESVPKNALVVFSNSDIYVDSTLRLLYTLDMHKKFLSLLRYDITLDVDAEAKLFGPRPDSQDTWIVAAESIDFEPTEADFGFTFGIPGCDNAINISMLRRKFSVVNPSLSLKTYHLHASNIRQYDAMNVIDKPMFLYVEPTGIQEYNAVKDLNIYKVASWQRTPPKAFSRPIKFVDKSTAMTICTMMKRDSQYDFSVDSSNTFSQGFSQYDNCLYKFNGPVFTMPSGVISDFKNLYIGEHPTWLNEWTNTQLTVLANTVHVPEIAAVHFPAELANSAAKWFLHYLPKVLEIRKHVKSRPEFIVPVHPDTQRALQLLKWPEKGQVTIIPYLADCQYVSDTTYALTPNSFNDVTTEHIQLLRSLLPIHEENQNPIAVLCSNRSTDSIVTKEWAEQVIKYVFERGDQGNWSVHIVDADTPTENRLSLLAKADLLIGPSESEWEALDWMWMMKPGASIIEIMPDTKPRGDHIHLAGAASLNYILLGAKREVIGYQRQHALEDINKTITEHLFKEALKAQVSKTSLPFIVLPTGKALSGIHDHAGDTFREMVSIWKERGYCNVVNSEDTPYVWWDGIGQMLLYDRPTLRWWQNPSYKLALFGNCFPDKPNRRDSVWSFWPRSPRAVEKMVISNKVMNGFKDRSISSIFLGRIENGVQRERRTIQDWSQVIEMFHMPIDSTGGPYKFTQEEYLTNLTKSRFGLCLPGFGPKCNREIEYFACGVVPIITPGVDMTNYFVPPVKETHYFTASTPEEVSHIIKTTTEERWAEMSIAGRAWWRRHASAEGLFRFTWGIIREREQELKVLDAIENVK